MSEVIDERVRELVRSSTIETREAVFEDLLRELMALSPDESEIPLLSDRGVLLGFFVRASALADATPEVQEAIKSLRERHHEFDPKELMSAEDFIRSLHHPSPVESR